MTAIHNLANKYREDFKLPNLKLPFNNRQGFYFSIPQKDIQGKLPSKFIQVVALKLFLLILAYEHLIFFVILLTPVGQNQVLRHGNNIHCSTLELASVSKITICLVFLALWFVVWYESYIFCRHKWCGGCANLPAN